MTKDIKGFSKDGPEESFYRPGELTAGGWETEAKRREVDAKLRLLATVVRDSNDAITVHDLEGKILAWNRGAERMYGFTEAEALGMNVSRIVPGDKRQEAHEIIAKVRAGTPVESLETNRVTKDGRLLDVWLTVTKLVDDDGNVVAVATTERDVTEQKRTMRELEQALREKEFLIREIHHRVKNNLLVVQSLLRLPLKHLRDEEAKEYLRESLNRVKSMSMIHERLYRTHDLSSINASEYIYSLGRMLFNSYEVGADRIKLKFSVPDIPLDVDVMIPCALILNELISNALKYAFPGERKGTIRVELQKAPGDEYVLLVADDGVGLPSDLDVYKTESMGMQIVTSMVNQLNGNLVLSRDGGTEFRITFNDRKRNATPDWGVHDLS